MQGPLFRGKNRKIKIGRIKNVVQSQAVAAEQVCLQPVLDVNKLNEEERVGSRLRSVGLRSVAHGIRSIAEDKKYSPLACLSASANSANSANSASCSSLSIETSSGTGGVDCRKRSELLVVECKLQDSKKVE